MCRIIPCRLVLFTVVLVLAQPGHHDRRSRRAGWAGASAQVGPGQAAGAAQRERAAMRA